MELRAGVKQKVQERDTNGSFSDIKYVLGLNKRADNPSEVWWGVVVTCG